MRNSGFLTQRGSPNDQNNHGMSKSISSLSHFQSFGGSGQINLTSHIEQQENRRLIKRHSCSQIPTIGEIERYTAPDCAEKQQEYKYNLIHQILDQKDDNLPKIGAKKRHPTKYFSGEDDEIPNFFPLKRLFINSWESILNLKDQLFVHIAKEKFIFIVVHACENESKEDESMFQLMLFKIRTKLSKFFKGNISPFGKVSEPHEERVKNKNSTSGVNEIDLDDSEIQELFKGIVTFEIPFTEMVGIEYQNTLFERGSRMTYEVRKCKKLWFPNLDSLFSYYNFPIHGGNGKNLYQPILNKRHDRILVNRVYPFDGESLGRLSNKLIRRRSSIVYLPLEEIITNFTLLGYFDDPILPFAMKQLFNTQRRANKLLMTKYESLIPTWAIYLPYYGIPYRPWVRYTVKYIITTISVITMLIGLYDLYTNVPLFQNYITSYVDSVIRWIGSKVMGISPFSMNITLYFGVICAHAQGFLLTILSSSITRGILIVISILWDSIKEIFCYLMILLRFIKTIFVHIRNLLYPLEWLIIQLFVIIKSALVILKDGFVLFISIPYYLFKGLFYSLSWMLTGFWSGMKSIKCLIFQTRTAAAATTDVLQKASHIANQGTKNIAGSFSIQSIQSFLRYLMQRIFFGGMKIYHTIMYLMRDVVCHQHTIYTYIRGIYRRKKRNANEFYMYHRPKIVKITNYLIIIFVASFAIKLGSYYFSKSN